MEAAQRRKTSLARHENDEKGVGRTGVQMPNLGCASGKFLRKNEPYIRLWICLPRRSPRSRETKRGLSRFSAKGGSAIA